MKPMTKADIGIARKKVDDELFRINSEIKSRVAQRERLEKERLRLMGVMNDFLAAELAEIQGEKQSSSKFSLRGCAASGGSPARQ